MDEGKKEQQTSSSIIIWTSWKTKDPDRLRQSCLTIVEEGHDEGKDVDDFVSLESSVDLRRPDQDKSAPCKVYIDFRSRQEVDEITRIGLMTSVKNIEVYRQGFREVDIEEDDDFEYVSTSKGELIVEDSDLVMFKHIVNIRRSNQLSRLRINLINIVEDDVWIFAIILFTRKTRLSPSSSSHVGGDFVTLFSQLALGKMPDRQPPSLNCSDMIMTFLDSKFTQIFSRLDVMDARLSRIEGRLSLDEMKERKE